MARARGRHRHGILRRSTCSPRGGQPLAAHPPNRADCLPAAGRSRRRRCADRGSLGDRHSDRRRTAPFGPRRHGCRRSSHARPPVVPGARHHVVARSVRDARCWRRRGLRHRSREPAFVPAGRPAGSRRLDLAILQAKGARVVGHLRGAGRAAGVVRRRPRVNCGGVRREARDAAEAPRRLRRRPTSIGRSPIPIRSSQSGLASSRHR